MLILRNYLNFLLQVVEVGGGWGKFLADVPPTESVLEAQKYVKDRLEKHWLLLFLATPEFIERQIPKGGSNEMVEDLLLQTRKRQQLITRVSIMTYILKALMQIF